MPPGGHPATHAQAARTNRVLVPPPAREKPDRLRCLAVAPSRETGSTDAPSPSPGLGTFANRDPLAGNAKETLSRLTAPTTLMTFTAAEGAGDH